MKLNGSQILIECLKEQGVDTVFGYPGGAILNVYDELYKHHEIRHILTSHEQGAAHAADGYARASGKVGVCFATSGPGATNLVTGIATAYMDSVPIVAITCNVGISLLGKDSFQEIDIQGITMPITKHNFIVKDVKDLAKAVRRAFSIARSGRPGPVLVDITKNATAEVFDFTPQKPEDSQKKSLPRITGIKKEELDAAAKLINAAKKPVIFVGGGAVISNAQKEVRELVDRVGAPVCDTLMGKGAFNGNDPRYLGMLGMHGTKASNLAVSGCDLLLVVGSRFSDRVIGNPKLFAKDAKIVQLDIDPAEVNKNIKVDTCVIGDIREVLIRLNPMIRKVYVPDQAADAAGNGIAADGAKAPAAGAATASDKGAKMLDPNISVCRIDWLKHCQEIGIKYPLHYDSDRLTGPYVMREIERLTKDDARIVTEVGQNQMWAAQYFRYKEPHQLFTSGGLGTMGYGLGASLGVKCAMPDKTVVNVAGDGCFRMNMNELATASRSNIPVIEVIMNNHVLGMVHQWQQLFYGERYSQTILKDEVDYVKVAKALGCLGLRVTKREEFAPAFEQAVFSGRPAVIDCVIEENDNVYPMVPPGKAISGVFDQDDMKK